MKLLKDYITKLLNETITEKWSKKYKASIDCNNPKGFSQRAHCQGNKKHLKENDASSDLYNDIENFINENNYNNLIYSCDLSKGNCDTITQKLYKYLLSIGYNDNDLQEIDLSNPKFETSEAHPEWQKYDKKYLVHTVLKVGNLFVDLTGSQYSKAQSGIKIYNKQEIGSLWGNYKIMKKDEEGKYIGGGFSNAKNRKF